MSILQKAITTKAKKNFNGVKVGLLDYGYFQLVTAVALAVPSFLLGGICLLAPYMIYMERKGFSVGDLGNSLFAFAIGGVLLFFPIYLLNKINVAFRCKRIIKKYLEIIVNENRVDIREFANVFSKSIDQVIDELQDMIAIGYLSSYAIDKNKLTIWRHAGINNANGPSKNLKEFKCKMCGANNAILLNQVSAIKCEYCDYPSLH